MGAPKGNINAAKYKPLYDALRKAIVQDDRARLDAGAQRLLDKYAEGDLQAAQFVRDTLEGKPAQSVAIEGGDPDKPLMFGWMTPPKS